MRETKYSIKLRCGTTLRFYEINGGKFLSSIEGANNDYNGCFYNCIAYWLNEYDPRNTVDPFALKLQSVSYDGYVIGEMAGNQVMLNIAYDFKVKFFYYLCHDNKGIPHCYKTLQYGDDDFVTIGHIAVYNSHCYVLISS